MVRSVLVKSNGGLTGAIRQGGGYYVYAAVVDPGDPASGVSTVRADVSSITTGSTSAPMTSGSYTVAGLTYGWRTALLTATNPQAAGARTFTVTATDVAGNNSGPIAAGATIDNTRPVASAVDVTNGGATVGRAETGDVVWLTMSELLDPQSILAGWDGSPTTMRVWLRQNGGGDRVQFRNAADTATLPLGTVLLANTGYVTADTFFPGSTMQQIGGLIRITLGTPTSTTAIGTVSTASTASWTPSATPYDAVGNASLTTSVSETGPADVQF